VRLRPGVRPPIRETGGNYTMDKIIVLTAGYAQAVKGRRFIRGVEKAMHTNLTITIMLLGIVLGAPFGAQADTFTFTTIDAPPCCFTIAYGINDAGQIVGVASDGGGFVKDGTTFAAIDVPGAVYTYPYRINNTGQTVGVAFFDGGIGWRSFVKDGALVTNINIPGAN
jgi:hypothetical protein